MMARDLVIIEPVLILGCFEKPFACLGMSGLDGCITNINLIKPQGIQKAFSLFYYGDSVCAEWDLNSVCWSIKS